MMEMEETQKKVKKGGPGRRPVLDARSRLLVSTLRDYFAKERESLVPLVFPSDTVGRTATALRLDDETVKAIINGEFTGYEVNRESDTEDDDADKSVEKIGNPDLDCFKLEAIRQLLHLYLMKSEPLTRKKLKKVLRKANLMPLAKTLPTVIYHLGFYWKKCLTSEILLERDDYVSKRCKFLRTMQSLNLKDVIWIGESCLYLTCVNKMPYTKRPGTMSRGGRVILQHAGSYNGWVPGAQQITISRRTNNFHEDIGSKGFLEWFDKLLDLIPENSVIILESNICHSEEVDKPPKENNTREEICEWLGRHNVWVNEESDDLYKAELLGIVTETKPFFPTYLADDMAAKCGHTVLRLPPNHSHFNPIEKIYQRIQTQVERRADASGGLGLSDLESYTHTAVANVGQKAWAEAVTQAGHLISKYWAQEPKRQQAVESLISNILTLKRTGRAYINPDGEIVNQAVSDLESDNEHHLAYTKRIKISNPDPEEMERNVHFLTEPIIEIITGIPDVTPTDDLGLFQIQVASDDSLSDVPSSLDILF